MAIVSLSSDQTLFAEHETRKIFLENFQFTFSTEIYIVRLVMFKDILMSTLLHDYFYRYGYTQVS